MANDPAPRNQLIELPPLDESIVKSIEELSRHMKVQLAPIVAVRYLVANNILCGLDERERQLLEALTELQRLREENAELTRKGLELCTAFGSSLIAIADARIAMERAHQLIENGMEVRAMECLGRAVDALPTPLSDGGSK